MLVAREGPTRPAVAWRRPGPCSRSCSAASGDRPGWRALTKGLRPLFAKRGLRHKPTSFFRALDARGGIRGLSCGNKHATGARYTYRCTGTQARGTGHGQDSRVGGGQGGRRGRSRRASSAAGASHRARRSADRRRRPRSTAARPRPACCLSLPFWLRRRPRGTRGCRRGAAAAMPGQLRRARSNERDGAPRSMLARSTPSPALAGDAPESCLLSLAAC